MVAIEKTIVINLPQREVFDFVSNPANAHKWQSVVKSKQWTSDGPPGVGSTQRVVARWLGLNIESTNEYTVWDSPNQNRFKTSNGPFRMEEGIRFKPEGNSTKLIWGMQVESGSVFRLLEGFLKKQAERTMVTDLESLKLLMEGGSV